MKKKSHLLCAIVLLGLLACKTPPTFSLQGYYFVGGADEKTAQEENPHILRAVEEIVLAVYDKNAETILRYIDKKEGAVIDAKAFASFAEIRTALTTPSSQLYRVLWSDDYWKETAPKDNIVSYSTSFGKAKQIRVALYWYSPTECEARLDFKSRPAMGIMGNLIFRKKDTRWYLMNFF